MQTDGVQVAFDLILEEIGSVSNELKEEAKELVDKDSHKEVISMMKTAEELVLFQLRVKSLQAEWLSSFDPVTRGKTQFDPDLQEVEAAETLALIMSYAGAVAEAHLLGTNEIRLATGSTVRKDMYDSLPEHVKEARSFSVADGSLISKSLEFFEVKKSITFSSPSAAACFVAGCSVSGPREWHIKGKAESLRQWRARGKSSKQ